MGANLGLKGSFGDSKETSETLQKDNVQFEGYIEEIYVFAKNNIEKCLLDYDRHYGAEGENSTTLEKILLPGLGVPENCNYYLKIILDETQEFDGHVLKIVEGINPLVDKELLKEWLIRIKENIIAITKDIKSDMFIKNITEGLVEKLIEILVEKKILSTENSEDKKFIISFLDYGFVYGD